MGSRLRKRQARRKRRLVDNANRDQRRVDLHMHSTLSDGILSIGELLESCARGKLDIISITDHDMAPEVPYGPHVFQEHTLWHIHGVELTTCYAGQDIHLLAYFPKEMPPTMRLFCRQQAIRRAVRYDELVSKLGLAGIEGAPLKAHAGQCAMTRLQLAKEIIRLGYASSIQQAFVQYIKNINLESRFPSIEEMVTLVKNSGGIISWAHPDVQNARKWAGHFSSLGLDALEAYRPLKQKKYRKSIKEIARQHNLHVTGGSDSHGWGEKLGTFAFPAEEIRSWAGRFIAFDT